MGQLSTEQAVRLVNAIGEAIPKPEPQNYWFLLLISLIAVLSSWCLTRKK